MVLIQQEKQIKEEGKHTANKRKEEIKAV